MASLTDPDRILALGYARRAVRQKLEPLWRLDEVLGQIVASAREPMLGEIRLAWWREQLEARNAKAHELIEAQQADLRILAAIPQGWALLLQPMPLDEDTLRDYASKRGGTVFAVCAPDSKSAEACGMGWALADFGFRCSDAMTRDTALALARHYLANVDFRRIPLPLSIVTHFAILDVAQGWPRNTVPGTPIRAWRALKFAASQI